jgi:DNA-binding NarL/FixJ family response regulator
MRYVVTSFPGFVVTDGPNGLGGAVIRIILADSEAVYRVGLLEVLTSEIDMRVVAQTDTLAGVHRAVDRFFISSPTPSASTSAIILLEGHIIPATSNVISELVSRAPQAKIIAQLDEKDEFNTVDLYHRGARGIIPRSISPELLVKCVRKVAAGETWVDNPSANRLIEAYQCQVTESTRPRNQPGLSPKELAIISCITQGMRNKEIACQLGTTEQAIKNCLRRVYDKLGVSDRLELAVYGLRHLVHKEASDPGLVRGASGPVPEIQSRPNGACRA